jgi:hypothetical protein
MQLKRKLVAATPRRHGEMCRPGTVSDFTKRQTSQMARR